MSLGFSVGDFLAVLELANNTRKIFKGAPTQFKQIESDVRGLDIVLRDVETSADRYDMTEVQAIRLHKIHESCRCVLEDTRKELNKYRSLESEGTTGKERTKRIWQRLKWEPVEIRDLRSRIIVETAQLNAFIAASTRDDVKKLLEGQDEQQRQKFLNWLTPIDSTLQQSDLISRRQEGTGLWLFESPEYTKWQAAKEAILFCHGIPGAGKTILASTVIDNLEKEYALNTDVAICYFYCDFKRQREQRIDDVALQFLRQLVQQISRNIPEDLKKLFDRYQAGGGRPTSAEGIKTLHSVAGLFSRVFIVVDALDECQSYQRMLIDQLLELQHLNKATILVTSRPVPDIMKKFQGSTFLEIRASKDDIERYIDGNKQDLPDFTQFHPELFIELSDAIVNAIDGMFLLAKLHFDSLKDETSQKQFRKALAELPTGKDACDEVYRNTVRRIREQGRGKKDLAEKTLMWITHARQPLTTTELLHALAVEIGEQEFDKNNMSSIGTTVSACCGLVTVDEESEIVRLIHYTTQEFFERHRDRYFPDANAQIADTCITYMSFNVFGNGPCRDIYDFERRLTEFPLYEYSSRYWGYYWNSCQKAGENSELIERFLSSSSHVQSSSQALLFDRRRFMNLENVPSEMTWLHLAAFLGIGLQTVSLVLDDLALDVLDSHGRTPVSYAASNGHDAMVRMLLDKDAQVDTADNRGRTALTWAAENGHVAIARLLLDKNAQVDPVDVLGRTPLLRAAKDGHEAVVRLLLDKNAYVDTADNRGKTALSWAAAEGHVAVARLLLDENKQIIDTADSYGQTALSLAAESGHEAVVRSLLDKDAQVDSTDTDGRTPLSWAAESGHEAVVRSLLDKDAQVDTADTDGRTPLSWAAARGCEAVVRLLLDKNAQVETANKSGQTPLWWATANGREAVVRSLLDKDAQVDTADIDGRTPLSWAAARGYETIVRLLLDKNAQVETADKSGQTPLWWAAAKGHESIVHLLQKSGSNRKRGSDSVYLAKEAS